MKQMEQGARKDSTIEYKIHLEIVNQSINSINANQLLHIGIILKHQIN